MCHIVALDVRCPPLPRPRLTLAGFQTFQPSNVRRGRAGGGQKFILLLRLRALCHNNYQLQGTSKSS